MKKPERLNTGIVGIGKKPVKMQKPLTSIEVGADPLAHLPYDGTHEENAVAELDEMQIAFRARAKQEAERFKNTTDSTYYFCMVFESGEQASAFLAGIGYTGKGDLFIDGREVAQSMGIDLPKAEIRYNISEKTDKKLTRLAGPISRG